MQTKTHSLIEAVTSTAVGFFISWLLTFYAMPLWGIVTTSKTAIEITTMFTIASVIRSYVLRRIFNRYHKRTYNDR